MKKLFSLLTILLFSVLLFLFYKGFFFAFPEGEVDILEKVEIGGVEQWIMANGKSNDLPVLLWVHGGPGAAQMAGGRYYNGSLEDEFIVVHWDQRGAGKSNSENFDENTLNVNQFLSDVEDMTEYLKERFGKEKIFLLGHSWGSYIGILSVSKNPESYHGYIGVSQVVLIKDQQILAYEETFKKN
jgi:pimeloyl-ACP methyl ester carboxylesterase